MINKIKYKLKDFTLIWKRYKVLKILKKVKIQILLWIKQVQKVVF